MLRFLIALSVFVSCASPSEDGVDSPIEFPKNEGDIELEELSTVLPDTDDVEPTLIGGAPAVPADWPATVYSSQGNSRCTATVIGPKTLAIAAHCVGNGKTAAFSVAGKRYASTCTHSKLYSGNSTADWALCLVAETVTGIKYEKVAQTEVVSVGEEILLTGYGCTRSNGNGGNDGVYRIGKSKITALPSGRSNDIVTKGGAALCYGDSGGPAFKIYADGSRVQLSINSRGNIRDTSYLSALFTKAAVDFYGAWAELHKQKICGVHADAPDCRGATQPEPEPSPEPEPTPEPQPEPQPQPEPKPLPEECKASMVKMDLCLYGKPPHAHTEKQACHVALGQLSQCLGLAEKAVLF
jgi:hypothetical protein